MRGGTRSPRWTDPCKHMHGEDNSVQARAQPSLRSQTCSEQPTWHMIVLKQNRSGDDWLLGSRLEKTRTWTKLLVYHWSNCVVPGHTISGHMHIVADCCPAIASRIHKIASHTASAWGFIRSMPGNGTRFDSFYSHSTRFNRPSSDAQLLTWHWRRSRRRCNRRSHTRRRRSRSRSNCWSDHRSHTRWRWRRSHRRGWCWEWCALL